MRGRLIGIVALAAAAVGFLSTPVASQAEVAVPSAPGLARAVPGEGQATVTWPAPTRDGGSPITGYEVATYLDQDLVATTAFDATTTTRTITGLVNSLPYRFRVAAVNEAGTGPSSPMPGAFGFVIPGTTLAPTGVIATGGAGSATVTWTPPAAVGGFPATEYDITIFPAGYPIPVQSYRVIGGTTSTVNLSPGTYSFGVAGVNARGQGATARSSPVTIGVAPPGAPIGVTATPTDGTVVLRWTGAPSPLPIEGWEVTTIIDGQAGAPVTLGRTTSRYRPPGVANGDEVGFRVAARSAAGLGPATESAVVVAGAPGPPGVGRRVAAGDGSMTVTWSAPTVDNGAPVTGYVVTPVRDGVPEAPVAFASTDRTQTIPGLVNGGRYVFRVAAVNERGVGTSLLPGFFQSAVAGAPAAPVVTASIQPLGVAVSWNEPEGNGAPVTGYQVFLVPAGGSVFTVTPVVTTQRSLLLSFTAGPTSRYDLFVLARNARGEGLAGRGSAAPAEPLTS